MHSLPCLPLSTGPAGETPGLSTSIPSGLKDKGQGLNGSVTAERPGPCAQASSHTELCLEGAVVAGYHPEWTVCRWRQCCDLRVTHDEIQQHVMVVGRK